MQTVSKAYSLMWRNARHIKEHRAIIAGVTYSEDDIVGTPRTSRSLFGGNVPTVGGCAAGQFDLQVIPKGEIPRMADVKLQTRLACEKYAAKAMVFFNAIAEQRSFYVVAPDGQTWYFEVPFQSDPVNGATYHAATVQWSVSGGIVGTTAGAYKDSTTGAMQTWGEDLVFSRTAPDHETVNFCSKWPWTSNGWEYSEWIPKGAFFIDTRKLDTESGVITLHGFDAMLKGDAQFLQEGDTGEWPRASSVIVGQICKIMGLVDEDGNPLIDERTQLDDEIKVPYPNDWTCREILSYIAVAHCGNWTITDAGKLRLVPLWSIPEATHYLVDQYGDPITLGGVKILV